MLGSVRLMAATRYQGLRMQHARADQLNDEAENDEQPCMRHGVQLSRLNVGGKVDAGGLKRNQAGMPGLVIEEDDPRSGAAGHRAVVGNGSAAISNQ